MMGDSGRLWRWRRLSLAGLLVVAAAASSLAAPSAGLAQDQDQAQSQGPIQSLNKALATTYETNPSLAAARAALRATNEKVAQARSHWGPVGRLVGVIGAGSSDKTSGAPVGRGPAFDARRTAR